MTTNETKVPCPRCGELVTLTDYQVRAMHGGNLMESDTVCVPCLDDAAERNADEFDRGRAGDPGRERFGSA